MITKTDYSCCQVASYLSLLQFNNQAHTISATNILPLSSQSMPASRNGGFRPPMFPMLKPLEVLLDLGQESKTKKPGMCTRLVGEYISSLDISLIQQWY